MTADTENNSTEMENKPLSESDNDTDVTSNATSSAVKNIAADVKVTEPVDPQLGVDPQLDAEAEVSVDVVGASRSSETMLSADDEKTSEQTDESQLTESTELEGPDVLFNEQLAPVPEEKLTPKEKALKALRDKAMAEQTEMPFAVVDGEAMTQIPIDLYIPPDALEVFLDAFEGPLDLLLYLIRKQNLDVLNINVFEITKQYMDYIDLMHGMQLELASEYLVMASMLAEIKSRMLLPRHKEEGGDEEEDPRAELIRRLQEYEQFKEAAENIDEMPRVGRNIFLSDELRPDYEKPKLHPDVDMREILLAFKDVMSRAEMFEGHEVQREMLSTRQRMGEVLDTLQGKAFVPFVTLFESSEGRMGVLVTFLAILELAKESLIDLVQSDVFAPIHVKAKSE